MSDFARDFDAQRVADEGRQRELAAAWDAGKDAQAWHLNPYRKTATPDVQETPC